MLHLCLAGPDLTGQYALVDHLRRRHVVTLVTESHWLDDPSIVATSDALALEAAEKWRAQLRALHHRLPELPIVLVDGELTDEEKAEAFALGALDFFPAPCRADLLAERLVFLAHAGRRQPTLEASGAASGTSVTPVTPGPPVHNVPAA